jgi:diketogulonate reductase-like aldo/keto reductase
MKAQRDQYVKQALKNKVPIFEVAQEYGLSEAEIGELIKGQGPPRKDDILDARNQPQGRR